VAVRAIIALSLAALAWAQCAKAGDDLSCAQYREAMAYNACLARHGPKANNLVGFRAGTRPGRGVKGEARTQAQASPVNGWRRSGRTHGRVRMEFQVR
jgi:hypothetical protein